MIVNEGLLLTIVNDFFKNDRFKKNRMKNGRKSF